MVLMTTKEIPYRLNPIGMVSSFARRQVASPFTIAKSKNSRPKNKMCH